MIRKRNEVIAYIRDDDGTVTMGTMADFFCNSGDSKPTTGIVNGSTCIEVDTGKLFLFNEVAGSWVEVQ